MIVTNPSSLPRRDVLRLGAGVAVVVSASAFGAACQVMEHTVRTPDEAAIRRGIASGARRLILPAGRISLARTLTLPPGVSLIGAGADRTLFFAGDGLGPANAMIEATGEGVVLSDFSVDGQARGDGGAGHGIEMRGSGHRLSGLRVSNVAQAGYRLSISDTEIVNCVALDCGRRGHTDNHGFMLFGANGDGAGAVSNVVFRECVAENAFRKGFALYTNGPAVSDVSFETCVARGCGVALSSGGGFYLVPADGQRMTGVSVRDCRAEGNYVNYEIGPVTRLMVTGCLSRDARATGFLFHGSRQFEIVGNTDEASGVDAMRFDEVLSTSSDGRVADNVLTNANRQSRGFASYINLQGAEGVVVAGNSFGDTEGARAPFGIYEGPRGGRNQVRDNRPIQRR
jgi:hypothetical protein